MADNGVFSSSSCIILETVDSTNAYLKKWMAREVLKEGTVVVARQQTAGRGQMGTSWESQPGKNLTFSMVLYPLFLPFAESFLISQLVALGIKDVLDGYTNDITVKWPNDIYWQDKKLAGILVENAVQGDKFQSAVAGIGLNVNQEKFYSNAPNPVSLKQITGTTVELEDLLPQLISSILHYYDLIREEEKRLVVRQLYLQSLYRKNGYHQYSDAIGDFNARIFDVEKNGHITLEDEAGNLRRYGFKEIQVFPSTVILP